MIKDLFALQADPGGSRRTLGFHSRLGPLDWWHQEICGEDGATGSSKDATNRAPGLTSSKDATNGTRMLLVVMPLLLLARTLLEDGATGSNLTEDLPAEMVC